MPEPVQSETREAPDPDRSAAERSADRLAISSSISELLPALIAKLGATGLAELEVRLDGLRVRLRRPADGTVPHDHRAGDRTDRSDRPRGPSAHQAGLTPVGPGREARDGRDGREPRPQEARDERRTVATSPAVGIFQPRSGAKAGTRVRAGDRLGSVDMLGIPQEVVAPADGLVGASLVEAGDAVEFGQGLIVIEFASAAVATAPPPSTTADG